MGKSRNVVIRYRDGREERLEGVEDVTVSTTGVFVIDQGDERLYVMGDAVESVRVTPVEEHLV